MTRMKLVPIEPDDVILDTVLDKMGQRVEPYTAPRESGVPIDSDIDEETANYCNLAAKEGFSAVYRHAISAIPPISDADLDWLCRCMWGDTVSPPEHFTANREMRSRMRAFIAAIASVEDGHGA